MFLITSNVQLFLTSLIIMTHLIPDDHILPQPIPDDHILTCHILEYNLAHHTLGDYNLTLPISLSKNLFSAPSPHPRAKRERIFSLLRINHFSLDYKIKHEGFQ